MKVKIIKTETLDELEVLVNKFIDKLGVEYYVKDIKVFCLPSIMGNYFGAMLILVRNSED